MFSTKGPSGLDTPFHHETCSCWKPMSINLFLTLWSCVQLKESLPFCTDVRALRLFTTFSGDENFIVPESSLVLPCWPKTQKTLGTRLSMTSMCTIGQWGVCYAYLRSKLLHLPIYTPWPLIPSHINYVILFYSFEIPLQNLCPTSKEVHVHGKNPQVTFDLETFPSKSSRQRVTCSITLYMPPQSESSVKKVLHVGINWPQWWDFQHVLEAGFHRPRRWNQSSVQNTARLSLRFQVAG